MEEIEKWERLGKGRGNEGPTTKEGRKGGKG